MLIDEIQFWDSTEPPSKIGSRKPSVSAIEVAQIAVDSLGSNVISSNEPRSTDPKDRRSNRKSTNSISKQEMCMQLDAIRLRKEGQSPKRL